MLKFPKELDELEEEKGSLRVEYTTIKKECKTAKKDGLTVDNNNNTYVKFKKSHPKCIKKFGML